MTSRRPHNALLSLTLDDQGLHIVLLQRTNGHVQVRKDFRVPLALNPLTAEPQLAGREIRNHLDQAGVRERHCVVGLPLQAAFSLHVKLPDLPEEDLQSFLQVEAERGLPYSPDMLVIGISRCRTPESFATLVAIPRQHLVNLQQALQAAQLRPLSFSLAAAALQSAADSAAPPVATLILTETHAELMVSSGQSIAAMRSLDLHADSEGQGPDLAWLAREIRVTLGHLPESFVDRMSRLDLYWVNAQAQALAVELGQRLTPLGFELRSAPVPSHLQKIIPPDAPGSIALFQGATYLRGDRPALQFLPPKVSRFQQFATRVQSRRLAWAGAAAALLLLLAGSAFGYQHWKLSRLEKEWTSMERDVTQLDSLQNEIKRFRPWFDSPFRSLIILRQIAEAFPEEGRVTAKSLEIRELAAVTLTGVAQDNQAFLETLDKLKADQAVADLKVDNLKGKAPLQFTFNFNWVEHRDR